MHILANFAPVAVNAHVDHHPTLALSCLIVIWLQYLNAKPPTLIK